LPVDFELLFIGTPSACFSRIDRSASRHVWRQRPLSYPRIRSIVPLSGTSIAHCASCVPDFCLDTCALRQQSHVRRSHFRASHSQASRPPLSKTPDLLTQHLFSGVSSSPPPHEPATPPRHHSWPFRPCMTSVHQPGQRPSSYGAARPRRPGGCARATVSTRRTSATGWLSGLRGGFTYGHACRCHPPDLRGKFHPGG
jgi:hypothetical protein